MAEKPPAAELTASELLVVNALLVAAFVASGRLGLYLAVPPGYATALWLPSGLALLAVLLGGSALLPGVWLGSCIVNTWIGMAGGAAFASSCGLAALIGLGSVVQAGIGARLGRYWVVRSSLAEVHASPRALLQLLTLAGPLTCFASPSWGQFVLYVSGRISPEQMPLSWFMWWIGDTIGVLLVLPLAAAVLATRGAARWREVLVVAIPVVLAIIFAILLFFRSAVFEAPLAVNPAVGSIRQAVPWRTVQAWGAFAVTLMGAAGLEVFLVILTSQNAVLVAEMKRRQGVEAELAQRSVDLARARDAAEAASRAKSAFLANMSHEIRTPLGVVLGYSELLADPTLPATDRALFLSAVQRNGALLSAVISDILDLSTVEAGELSLSKLPVSAGEMLAQVSDLLARQAATKGLWFTTNSQVPERLRIETDPIRLQQILLNIVGNAVKFTSRGGVDVVAKCVSGRSAVGARVELVHFVVRDTGPGIAVEEAARLFAPFTQADGSYKRQHGGTGLGLILSRRLAQFLGGDVVLTSSTPGVGSTFTIAIDPGPQGGVGLPPLPHPVGPPLKVSLKGKRIMVVDDSPDNRLLVSRFLNAAGALVETAVNGKEAIEKAHAAAFDLLLMDLQMPIMDGYEAVEHLRREGCQQPIIALTAHALKEDREFCLSRGFDEHISKPIDRRALLGMIERFS